MKTTQSIAIFCLIMGILISGCGAAAEPVPTATAVPATATVIPPTETAAPTDMPTYEPLVDIVLSNWNGVPVMPSAVSGQEYFGDYRFEVKESADEISAFYQQEMPNLGWEFRQDMVGSSSEMVFSQKEVYAFFMIASEGENNFVYIHLVQQE